MIQAFDVLLQIPVTADIAAKNRIDEPFRYECLCCGEEVYIAATNSTKKAPHFRHRRGNSDRECELYLGSTGIAGALNAAQKRTHSRTEIAKINRNICLILNATYCGGHCETILVKVQITL